MKTTWMAGALPILLLVLGLGALGIRLLVKGMWPRRVGQTPHCPRCTYILAGNTTGTCPECGTAFTERTIKYGERIRNPRKVLLGSALLLPLLIALSLVLVAGIRELQWYRMVPMRWVVSDLEAGRPQAASEIQRRLKGELLDGSNHNRVVEVALRELAAAKPSASVYWLVDYLGQSEVAGKLTEDQRKRFFSAVHQYQVQSRPVVAVGEQIPVAVSYRFRLPHSWRLEHEAMERKLDGQVVRRGGGSGGASGVGAGGSSSMLLPPAPAGEHTAEVVERVRIYAGVTPEGKGVNLRHEEMVRLQVPVKVVEDQTAQTIKLIDDPKLAEAIRQGLTVEEAFIALRPSGDRDLTLTIRTRSLPVNVAFEVILKTDREHRLGTMMARTTDKSGYVFQIRAAEVGNPTKADIILRTTKTAARQTVDVYEIWNGEIVLKDVTFERRPKP